MERRSVASLFDLSVMLDMGLSIVPQQEAMRARIRSLRRALLRRVRYKVTRGGLLFTAAVLMAGISAVVSANNLLFLILAMMLATLLVSGFISRLGLAGLELDVEPPEHLSAGRPAWARLRLRNLKNWMPSFSIQVTGWENTPLAISSPIYFPVVPGGAVLEEGVEVRFMKRGLYSGSTFAFSTRFPFGFLEKTSRVTLARELIVYPSVDPQPGLDELFDRLAGALAANQRGPGDDFYRIRPYQVFESARQLDWKASAHTGEAQVREFARDRDQPVEVYFDRYMPDGMDEQFEHAVDCCAHLVWRLTGTGAAIRFYSQGLTDETEIYTILKYLALVTPGDGVPPQHPFDDTTIPLVVTLSPARFSSPGWSAALVLDATMFDPRGPDRPADRTAEDFDHHRGTDHR